METGVNEKTSNYLQARISNLSSYERNVTSVEVTPRTKQLGVTPRTPLFEGKKPENQKTIISYHKLQITINFIFSLC